MKRPQVVAAMLVIMTSCSPSPAAPTGTPATSGTTTASSPISTTATTAIPATSAPTTGTTAAPTSTEPPDPCLARANFGDPASSPYLLPFPPGKRYQVSQSYCVQLGGHRNQLAYDFDLPIGEDVLAIRAGKVIQLKEDSPDDGRGAGDHNFVFILHDDGSVAFYAHLRQDGVDVEVNDRVEAGQRIAASGNSGQTAGAHLHIQVFRRWPPNDDQDLPLVFSNAEGPLDPRGGLKQGGVYRAVDPG